MPGSLLIVFVKNPEPGLVKKRLAVSIGDHEAARVYREIAEKMIFAVDPGPDGRSWDMAVAYWPQDAAVSLRLWLGNGIRLMAQRGGDLGERLENAFDEGFAAGYGKISIIGSDCPSLTAEHIAEAFVKLGSCDAVFGPALDGGYYLIGLSRHARLLFSGISWSTDRVLLQSIDKCRATDMTWKLLPELRDIDTADDLAYFRNQGVLT